MRQHALRESVEGLFVPSELKGELNEGAVAEGISAKKSTSTES